MRTRSLALALVIPALAALTSCDSAEPDAPVDPAPVLPLAVGAEWTLAPVQSIQFAVGTIPTDTTDLRGSGEARTIAVTRDTVISGETWYRIEAPRLQHWVFHGEAWFANRTDGLYRWEDSLDEAVRVYAVGEAEGTVYLDTGETEATFSDDDATYQLSDGPVPTRRYDLAWDRLEFNEETRGPIEPEALGRDHISPTRGVVSLELSYVAYRGGESEGEDVYVPAGQILYELGAEARSSARVGSEFTGAVPVR